MDSFGLAFCWLTISYTDTVIESFCLSKTVLFWNKVILQPVSSMPTAADTAVDDEQQMQAILTTRTLALFLILLYLECTSSVFMKIILCVNYPLEIIIPKLA